MFKNKSFAKLTAMMLALVVMLSSTWLSVPAADEYAGQNGQPEQNGQTEQAENGTDGENGEPTGDIDEPSPGDYTPPVPDMPDVPYPGDLEIVTAIMLENGLTEGFAAWQPRGAYLRVVGLQMEQLGLDGDLGAC